MPYHKVINTEKRDVQGERSNHFEEGDLVRVMPAACEQDRHRA